MATPSPANAPAPSPPPPPQGGSALWREGRASRLRGPARRSGPGREGTQAAPRPTGCRGDAAQGSALGPDAEGDKDGEQEEEGKAKTEPAAGPERKPKVAQEKRLHARPQCCTSPRHSCRSLGPRVGVLRIMQRWASSKPVLWIVRARCGSRSRMVASGRPRSTWVAMTQGHHLDMLRDHWQRGRRRRRQG